MKSKNYAFIDGNNLYLGAKSQDIELDYGKLRKYLRTKFNVEKAFLFIGYDPHNTTLYSALQTYGYVSDGDFACLMRYLSDNDKLKKIITPTERFSKLLKPFVDNILPLKTIENQIKKK